MKIELSAGMQLASTVCDTQVVVVRPPAEPLEISCGGAPMVPLDEAGERTGTPAPGAAEGTLLGKRYVAPDVDLEILCTKPGEGSLQVNGETLTVKEAKPLPSSD